MPVLSNSDVRIVTLPKSGAVVFIDVAMPVDHFVDIQKGQDLSPIESTALILAKAIKSWDFTDMAGDPSPITADSIRQLSRVDFSFIENTMMNTHEQEGLLDDEKKDSSPPSSDLGEASN